VADVAGRRASRRPASAAVQLTLPATPPGPAHECRSFVYYTAGQFVRRRCLGCGVFERGRWVRIVDRPDADH